MGYNPSEANDMEIERLAVKLSIIGIGMIIFGVLYAFFAPSPVDVLIDDYRDGYAPKEASTSTSRERGTSTPEVPSSEDEE